MKERKIIKRMIYFIFAIVVIYIAIDYSAPREKMSFGVSFSKPFAQSYGLNWREAYLAIFKDLGVKKIRLSSYWTEIEPAQGNFQFDDLDWQIAEAEKNGARIILTLGQKQPRWPECHIPDWAKSLSKSDREEKVMKMTAKVVARYKNRNSIAFWQVENEPLFVFGDCPDSDPNFLEKEVAVVRSMDSRPIIITDSGERSIWYPSAKRADIFGTTLYRIVWDGKWGYMSYPIPASLYIVKAQIIKAITGVRSVIIAELQAEAWGPKPTAEMSLAEQAKSMDPEKFRSIVAYARSTGFSEAYLWGVEYWYWLKTMKGDPAMWEEAKKVFKE